MKAPAFYSRGRRRGSALLLVMISLMILTGAVLAWAKMIRQEIALANEANRNAEARAMAHSGVAMAMHPLVSQRSPQLEKDFGGNMGYRVRIVGEGGKLHLNWLLAGEDPRKLAILKAYLGRLGLDFRQREVVVDCLLDYVDADSLKRLNGEEDEGDYHPANRPFVTLEEITQVRGAKALTERPGWKENFTLYSSGQIDLTSAPREVLGSLPGLGDAAINEFVQMRAGKDQILGTMDDPLLKTLQDVQRALKINDAQFKSLVSLVMAKDSVIHITAEGHSGKGIRQVEVVARKVSANTAILYWNE